MKLFVFVLFSLLLASAYCYPAKSEDVNAAPLEQEAAAVTDSHVRQKRGYYPVVGYGVSYPVYHAVAPVHVAPVHYAAYSVPVATYSHAYPATIYG